MLAQGQNARLSADIERVVRGEDLAELDGRSIQAFLSYRLADSLQTSLILRVAEGEVEIRCDGGPVQS